jgi:peptidoglycan hydrolase-like protein with peptidoglycan-binding domain
MMREMGKGAWGPDVSHLQRLLNKADRSLKLKTEGTFGPKTETALVNWQARNGVPATGRATLQTWNKLGHVDDFLPEVELYPQPSDQSCWSAAATMLFRDQSVWLGRAVKKTGSDHLLSTHPDNLKQFFAEHGMRFYPPKTIGIAELLDMLRKGPIWAAGAANGAVGIEGHVVVISGIYYGAGMQLDNTTFRIHDPWPPGKGAIYAAAFTGTTFAACNPTGHSFTAGMLALAQINYEGVTQSAGGTTGSW